MRCGKQVVKSLKEDMGSNLYPWQLILFRLIFAYGQRIKN